MVRRICSMSGLSGGARSLSLGANVRIVRKQTGLEWAFARMGKWTQEHDKAMQRMRGWARPLGFRESKT